MRFRLCWADCTSDMGASAWLTAPSLWVLLHLLRRDWMRPLVVKPDNTSWCCHIYLDNDEYSVLFSPSNADFCKALSACVFVLVTRQKSSCVALYICVAFHYIFVVSLVYLTVHCSCIALYVSFRSHFLSRKALVSRHFATSQVSFPGLEAAWE